MLSRARIFAAVTLLISCLAGPPARAQVQNLEAGKSASQLFASTCNACHKSPRGLLKTVSPGSLPGFLQEHYTTGSEMASQLASYVMSNGAGDSRQAKPGQDKQGLDKQGGNDQADHQGRKNRNAPTQEAARPDDGSPAGEGGRQGRKRLARPGEPSEEANAPAQATIERGPDSHRLSTRQRSGRPGRPGEEPPVATEPPKTESSKTESSKTESSKAEPGADDKAKAEPAKPDDAGKSSNEAKSEPAKSEPDRIEAPKDSAAGGRPVVRQDPVPPVTPTPAMASGGSSEPAAPRSPASVAPPAVTASAPPPPPPSTGAPVPPISQ